MEMLHIASPRLNELNLLSCIAANPHVTQAELSRRCGLSVAMVNNYMKVLSDSGLLEYHRRSSKSVSYHLTPAGTVQMGAIGQELLEEMVKLFGKAKERVLSLMLSQLGSARRVVLYGTGDLAVIVFHALESRQIRVVGVCEDDPNKIGLEWCGREISNPSQIRYLAPDAVILCDRERTEQIYRGLRYLQDRGIDLIRLDGATAREANANAQPVLSTPVESASDTEPHAVATGAGR